MTDWDTITPRRAGFSSARLNRLTESLAQHGTQALLVARDGKLVHEWNAPGRGPQNRHFSASLAKSLVGGMALLLALTDGRLAPDEQAAWYIPAWRDDPQKNRITIAHLAAHCSGLEDAETPGKGHFDQGGWKERFWRQEPDPFSIALNEAPLMFEPGSAYAYSNTGFAALGYVITASLRGAPQTTIADLLRARLVQPLRIGEVEWSVGYGKTFTVDDLDLHATWGGGEFSPRAAARVGQLLLQNGRWGSQLLIDPAWLRKATQQAAGPMPDDPTRPAPGLAWWSNSAGTWPYLPRDAFGGAGARHQLLLVVPSLGLVVVRNGEELGHDGFWESAARELLEPLTDCFLPVQPGDRRRAPYPPSPVIRGITFDPVSSIYRAAFDSDNWPVTWAAGGSQNTDSGDLFTAYGDGRGFEPYTEQKIGLGLARISGFSPNITASNVRAPSLENVGMGARGIKASGLLAVAGRLYLLGRNAGNAQLAWSDDEGRSWAWSDWKFSESFGYPTFLNFGPGYAGARDEFVYIYSHDGDSAYKPADRFVLARVPAGQVTERAAYQFFAGLDENSRGTPRWSPQIADRAAVFSNPGRCLRSGISYHPVLKRYLWWQQVPERGEDTRFAGGFGIYDAPEPWGPWTTGYYTSAWDTGPGEMANFPTKWFSPDGKTAYLVFSGYDYFSLRRCTIKW